MVHLKTPHPGTLCDFVCHKDNTLRNHYHREHRTKIKFAVLYKPEVSEITYLSELELKQDAIAGPEGDDGKVGHWTDGTLRESDPWICCYWGARFQTHEALKEHAPSHPEYVPKQMLRMRQGFQRQHNDNNTTYHSANTK
jgi:hypothetical protein